MVLLELTDCLTINNLINYNNLESQIKNYGLKKNTPSTRPIHKSMLRLSILFLCLSILFDILLFTKQMLYNIRLLESKPKVNKRKYIKLIDYKDNITFSMGVDFYINMTIQCGQTLKIITVIS